MTLLNTFSRSLIKADKGWRKFAPESGLKRPVSVWLTEQTTRINPQDGEAQHRLGLLLAEQERWEDAAEAYKRALVTGYTERQIYHHFGIVLFKSGRLDEAEEALRQAIAVSPTAVWSYLELGKVILETGRTAEAQNVLSSGLACAPNNFGLNHYFSVAKISQQRRIEAGEGIEHCVSGEGDKKDWAFLAKVDIIKHAATEENVGRIQRYIAENGASVSSLVTLGWLLSHLGRLPEGIAYLKQAGILRAAELVASGELKEEMVSQSTTLAPSFFILGPLKSGTSSLYVWLCQHPNIVSAIQKEMFYWSHYHHFGLDWYRSFLPPVAAESGMITGEGTANTIFQTDAPAQIRNFSPHAKLIVLVRDSIERAYSHYQMKVRQGNESRPFETVIQPELNYFENAPLTSEEMGDYRSDYLISSCLLPFSQAWLQHFPAKQMLFVESKRLFEQPEATVTSILEFLGMPSMQDFDVTPRNQGGYKSKVDPETWATLKAWFAPHDAAFKAFLTSGQVNVIGDFEQTL